MFSQAAKSVAKSLKRQKYVNSRDHSKMPLHKVTKSIGKRLSQVLRANSKQTIFKICESKPVSKHYFLYNNNIKSRNEDNKLKPTATNLVASEISKKSTEIKDSLPANKPDRILPQAGDKSIHGVQQMVQILGEMGPIAKRFWQSDYTSTQMYKWFSGSSVSKADPSFNPKLPPPDSPNSALKHQGEKFPSKQFSFQRNIKDFTLSNKVESKTFVSLANSIKQSVLMQKSKIAKASSAVANLQRLSATLISKASQLRLNKPNKHVTKRIKNIQTRPRTSDSNKQRNWTVPAIISDKKPLLLHDSTTGKSKPKIKMFSTVNNVTLTACPMDYSNQLVRKKKLNNINRQIMNLSTKASTNLVDESLQKNNMHIGKNNKTSGITFPSKRSNVNKKDTEVLYKNKCFNQTTNENIYDANTKDIGILQSNVTEQPQDIEKIDNDTSNMNKTNGSTESISNDKIVDSKFSFRVNELLSKIKREKLTSSTSILSSYSLENLFNLDEAEPAIAGALPDTGVHLRDVPSIPKGILSEINLYSKASKGKGSTFSRLKEFCTIKKKNDSKCAKPPEQSSKQGCSNNKNKKDPCKEDKCKKDPCKENKREPCKSDQRKANKCKSVSCEEETVKEEPCEEEICKRSKCQEAIVPCKKPQDLCYELRAGKTCKDYEPFICEDYEPCSYLRYRPDGTEIRLCHDPCKRYRNIKLCTQCQDYNSVACNMTDPCKCYRKMPLCKKECKPPTGKICNKDACKSDDNDSSCNAEPPKQTDPCKSECTENSYQPEETIAFENEKSKREYVTEKPTNCTTLGTPPKQKSDTLHCRRYSTYVSRISAEYYPFYNSNVNFNLQNQTYRSMFSSRSKLSSRKKVPLSKCTATNNVSKSMRILDTFGVLSDDNL